MTARGIAYSTSQDPTTSHNIVASGSGTGSFTANMSGLNPNTTYYLRAYATNIAGTEYGNQESFSTSLPDEFACGDDVTFSYRGQSVTYGTVEGQNGTCWLDRNLGASRVATAYNDSVAYGDLFQWGRGDDGHQLRTSGTTSTLSTTDNPGHGDFVSASASPWDWRSPQNDNLWQGDSGINDICPAGWRVPTEAELNNERLSWSINDYYGGFASPLKLVAGGSRSEFGSLGVVGYAGSYWSSSVSGSLALALYFTSSWANVGISYRVYGNSVRCIWDN